MKKKTKLKNSEGFTLIELIAVMVILGIMAAIAVPKFFDMQEDTEKKSLQIALNDLKGRAVTVFTLSLLEHNGAAQTTDFDSMADLGLPDLAAVQAAYTDYAGTWTAVTATTITYTVKNGGDTATFTLSGGSATEAPDVTMAFS